MADATQSDYLLCKAFLIPPSGKTRNTKLLKKLSQVPIRMKDRTIGKNNIMLAANHGGTRNMKRLALTAALFPGLSMAAIVGQPMGPNITYGDISINHNIVSNVTNPAFGATQIREDHNDYRVGILNLSGMYEVGKVDNIVDEADTASTALENTIDPNDFTVTPSGADFTISRAGNSVTIHSDQIIQNAVAGMNPADYPDTTSFNNELSTRVAAEMSKQVNAAANQLVASMINDIDTTIAPVVDSLNEDGYLKMGGAAYVPLTPFVVSHKALNGSLEVHASVSIQGRADYTSSYIEPSADVSVTVAPSGTGTGITDPNYWQASNVSPSFDIATDAAAVVKTAAIQEFGVGYSRSVLYREDGTLYAGGRLNLYRVGLAKSYTGLANSDNVDQVVQDQLDASLDMSSGFGVDVGTMWVAKNYRLGATINNLNAPSFDYKNVTDCSAFSNYVDANDPLNNVTSATLASCGTGESYTMDRQLKLEGVTSVWDDKLTLGMGYDVNAVADPFGQDYKWLTLSAGANLGNWAGIRGGYRANKASGGLTYYTAGLTLFTVNLDLGWSKEKIKYDGDSMPRSAYAGLSWALNF